MRNEKVSYGPKKILPVEGKPGYFVEVEMTEEEKDFARLESTLWWASPNCPGERTTPITPADAEKQPGLRSYIDGFAVFPKVEPYIPDSPERRKQESDWEKRSLAMHAAQVPVTPPPDKPEDDSTTGKYFRELKRGD